MLYENEELRLRTININAEVERGNYGDRATESSAVGKVLRGGPELELINYVTV
jgi:hypothetical protein